MERRVEQAHPQPSAPCPAAPPVAKSGPRGVTRSRAMLAWILVVDLVAVLGLGVTLWRLGPRLTWMGAAASPEIPTVISWKTNTLVLTNAFHWRQLESEDYETYIQNLRAIGCPEQTVRDIIIADLDLLWAPRLGAIVPRRPQLHYWQSEEAELLNDYDQREWQRQTQQINRDKRGVIRALVNADLASERSRLQGQDDDLDRRLGFLSPDKRMDAREALEHYQQEMAWIRDRSWEEGDSLTPEERETLGRLQEERETELNQLLTPEEKRRLDLWMSSTASAVRHDLYGMNATEQEFLAVYELRKAFDEAWPEAAFDPEDPLEANRRQQAQDTMDEQIAQTLGPERYALYQRGQDEEFHLLNRTVSRYGLAKNLAGTVYEFKTILESERQRVAMDVEITPEQRNTILGAMNEEVKLAVRELLGANAYNYYRRHSDWLKP